MGSRVTFCMLAPRRAPLPLTPTESAAESLPPVREQPKAGCHAWGEGCSGRGMEDAPESSNAFIDDAAACDSGDEEGADGLSTGSDDDADDEDAPPSMPPSPPSSPSPCVVVHDAASNALAAELGAR